MARRNKDTRVTPPRSSTPRRSEPITAEDVEQKRKFYIWTAVVTVVMMALIYFFLFR